MSELDPEKLRRLDRLVFMARCVITWERLWPRLWPFLILSSLFLISVLFDLFSLLPATLHLLILGSVLIACGVALVLAFRNLDTASTIEALHRLEKDSRLQNQPLFSLLDQPVGDPDNKLSQAIWIHHQDRMAAAMDHVVLSPPRSDLWKKDPWSVRAVLILFLVLGVIEARFDYSERFMRAFVPQTQSISSPQGWQAQLWITPPPHTGLGTQYVKADLQTHTQNQPLQLAQHSKILMRLKGRATRDAMTLSTGPFSEQLENLGKGIFSIESTIDQGKRLRILRDDQTLFDWPLEIIPDRPPVIKLSQRSQNGFRGHLALSYKADDDYGLKEAHLIIKSLEPSAHPILSLKQPLDGLSSRGSFRENLASHPWAGRTVVVSPKVIDNAGQSTFGQAIQLRLPERHFSHPIANQLITVRKSLYDEGLENRVYAKLALSQILKKPADFAHQIPVYLALRVSADRLDINMSDREITDIQDMLWQTAVHLDEGAAGTARNQLEDLARQMQELMKESANKSNMETLFEQMRQSLQQYLQQISQSQQSAETLQDAIGPENADFIGQDELMNMLEKARDLMRSGDMKSAQALMEQFQSILSRMAMQKPVNQQQVKEAQEIMNDLKAIQQDQQNLMDRTFQRSRNQDRPSMESTRNAIQESEDQKQLHERLGTQIDKLKAMGAKVPESLYDATRSMLRASQSLERGLDEDAIQAQIRAVDQLDDGLEESATSLAQKMGRRPLPNQQPGYDPLGRGMPARMNMGTGNTLPNEAEIHRSRQILQELYRRAGQKGRTDQELNYIERLLERF